MKTQFEKMNEAYIGKHFPNRSVFEAFAKKTKKAGIGVYIFFGAILAGCIYGIVWSMGSMSDYKQSGEMDMVQTGLIICIFFAVFALISAFCIGLTIWRSKRGGDDWLKQSAARSKLSESKIREFEQQAMMPDSYILKMTSGINAVVSGQRDGILTRDYVYLADNMLTVIPIEKLICACFVESVYYIGDMQNRKAMPYLALYLLSQNGVESFIEASVEAGTALEELLLSKNQQIETYKGRVLTTKEYENNKKQWIS